MKPYYQDDYVTIYNADCRDVLGRLPRNSVNCCVTSPPYYNLRDYGVAGQLGLEASPEKYVPELVAVFRALWDVLRDDGTLWLNLGDSYAQSGKSGLNEGWEDRCEGFNGGGKTAGAAHYKNNKRVPTGLKRKDLIGIPWRVAFALQQDGWYLRQDIIWHKPNPMPESVKDRCTSCHEHIFLLSKREQYYFDNEAIAEPQQEYERNRRLRGQSKGLNSTYNIASEGKTGQQPQSEGGAVKSLKARHDLAVKGTRNKRSVWTVSTKPYTEAHFAVFPADLITPCILAGCPKGGVVIDPFAGSGTVAMVAKQHNRKAINIELNREYLDMQIDRIKQGVLPL